MLKLRTVLIQLSLLLFAAISLNAQNVVATISSSSQSSSSSPGLAASAGTSQSGVIVSFGGSSALRGNTLQPLSADVTDETDKILADGTHIHRETHGKMFRDSQGRQRTEMEMDALGADNKPFKLIRITDPVEKQFVLLDFENKIARVTHYGQPPSNPDGSQNQARQDVPKKEPVPSANPAATAPQRSFEKLGVKEIAGFSATGTRNSTTLPVGAVGNDKPLTTISEHWNVQDLSLQVLSSVDDPRSGKRTYKLTNIQMGDPDPLLFQIPPDFTVKDARQQ